MNPVPAAFELLRGYFGVGRKKAQVAQIGKTKRRGVAQSRLFDFQILRVLSASVVNWRDRIPAVNPAPGWHASVVNPEARRLRSRAGRSC